MKVICADLNQATVLLWKLLLVSTTLDPFFRFLPHVHDGKRHVQRNNEFITRVLNTIIHNY